MKSLLMLPLWLVQVFTWSKSFRSNPIIGSPVLNRLGLHVLRVVVAEGLFRWRLWLLSPLVDREDRRMFREQGWILKRDFLPPEAFAALKGELLGYRGEITEVQEGDTRTQRVLLTRQTLQALPRCRALVEHPALDRVMRYASSKNRPPLYYIENLRLKAVDSALKDPQQDLHSDTFHPVRQGVAVCRRCLRPQRAACLCPGFPSPDLESAQVGVPGKPRGQRCRETARGRSLLGRVLSCHRAGPA